MVQLTPAPAPRHGVTAPLSLSTHSSCLNRWPNDFRFFPIFLYYYLWLLLLQFSDHELLNVCLLSNSLLPPRHTAAVLPAWDSLQLLPLAPPAAMGPLTVLGTRQGPTCCWGCGQGAMQALGPPKALSLAPLQQCKGSQPCDPWLGHGMHWDVLGCTGGLCSECSWGSTHRCEGICLAPIPAVKNSVPIHGQGHVGDHCAALMVMAGQGLEPRLTHGVCRSEEFSGG